MRRIHSIGLVLALICLTACSGEGDFEGVVMSSDYLDASSSLIIPGEGGETNVEIKANCDWTISTDASWLSIDTKSGNGNQSITISADKNRTNVDRSASLIVKSSHDAQKKITVSQGKPENSTLIPDPDDNLPPS